MSGIVPGSLGRPGTSWRPASRWGALRSHGGLGMVKPEFLSILRPKNTGLEASLTGPTPRVIVLRLALISTG
jgi:hypothetical protein